VSVPAVPPLRVHRLEPSAILPSRAHPGDAGLDLHALDGGTLEPGARRTVSTGLALEIPDGQAGLVLPRSGLAAVAGVDEPGRVDERDPGAGGEVRVLLLNTDPAQRFTWSAGDRIAQLVLVEVALAPVVEVDELSHSVRGEGGLGSSGA
jgi:dUTP pyrophosphatase